jgi:hypothetical protein
MDYIISSMEHNLSQKMHAKMLILSQVNYYLILEVLLMQRKSVKEELL